MSKKHIIAMCATFALCALLVLVPNRDVVLVEADEAPAMETEASALPDKVHELFFLLDGVFIPLDELMPVLGGQLEFAWELSDVCGEDFEAHVICWPHNFDLSYEFLGMVNHPNLGWVEVWGWVSRCIDCGTAA